MRAIDVYSGIGGWTCGLRLAGHEIIGSYEWWRAAVDTNNINNGSEFEPADVREMDLDSLPTSVNLVVGSPPCTQFSYANRGGDGDVDEGLKDVVRFLEVVRKVRPRFWAMENVPRVAKILAAGFRDPSHVLYPYRDLEPRVEILDLSKYGTPQVRKRCIAGNIPFDALAELSQAVSPNTLGAVIESLMATDDIIDPTWGIRLQVDHVSERETETPLTAEELRLNREAKEHHPVYNNMSFPDSLDAPARTITATCTRVSRESIVIFDERLGAHRRLSIRERACLQGFPITYQFYAPSYSQKVKMIGNAVPPTFSYLLGLAVEGRSLETAAFSMSSGSLDLPQPQPPTTRPDRPNGKYRETRRFRAAVPGLRFKSGVRFELCNEFTQGKVVWIVKFVHGTPKDIRELSLDGSGTRQLRGSTCMTGLRDWLNHEFLEAEERLRWITAESLQAVWTRRHEGIGPFEVIDFISEIAGRVLAALDDVPLDQLERCVLRLIGTGGDPSSNIKVLPRASKIRSNAAAIASGILVGDWFNHYLSSIEAKSAA